MSFTYLCPGEQGPGDIEEREEERHEKIKETEKGRDLETFGWQKKW